MFLNTECALLLQDRHTFNAKPELGLEDWTQTLNQLPSFRMNKVLNSCRSHWTLTDVGHTLRVIECEQTFAQDLILISQPAKTC